MWQNPSLTVVVPRSPIDGIRVPRQSDRPNLKRACVIASAVTLTSSKKSMEMICTIVAAVTLDCAKPNQNKSHAFQQSNTLLF